MQPPPQRPVALITGAAKRIGRAIALHLAGAGYDIALTYFRSETEARQLAAEIRAGGGACLDLQADLTQPVDAVAMLDAAFSARYDRLDVLVNNASLYEAGNLAQTDVEQLHRMWAIHVEAPLLLCRKFAPRLRSARGHIVNMLDLLAERPWPAYLGYCASKAALWNLTLALARELAPEVTVNGIAPGVAEWPEGFPEARKQTYLKRVPLGRAGTAEDVARAVVFLATKAPYMTGQVLRLDGGRSIT